MLGVLVGCRADMGALGWGFAVVSSRAFRLRGPSKPPSLLPLLDMCNHSFPLGAWDSWADHNGSSSVNGRGDLGGDRGANERRLRSAGVHHSNCEVVPCHGSGRPGEHGDGGSQEAWGFGAALVAGPNGARKGEALLVSYGDLRNDVLLLDYGSYRVV